MPRGTSVSLGGMQGDASGNLGKSRGNAGSPTPSAPSKKCDVPVAETLSTLFCHLTLFLFLFLFRIRC